MTREKLKSVFQFYLDVLTRESQRRELNEGTPSPGRPKHVRSEPKQFSGEDERSHFVVPPAGEVAHLRFMCIEASKFVDAGRVEKAMRWLGFLQGVLWARGFYSLEDLKNHSRPDRELPDIEIMSKGV